MRGLRGSLRSRRSEEDCDEGDEHAARVEVENMERILVVIVCRAPHTTERGESRLRVRPSATRAARGTEAPRTTKEEGDSSRPFRAMRATRAVLFVSLWVVSAAVREGHAPSLHAVSDVHDARHVGSTNRPVGESLPRLAASGATVGILRDRDGPARAICTAHPPNRPPRAMQACSAPAPRRVLETRAASHTRAWATPRWCS